MDNNNFKVLKRAEVSEKNQEVFDRLTKTYGAVPNLYSTLAYSENALEAYINLESTKLSISDKQAEAVNLVVSEINGCIYCTSAHTMVAQKTGFTKEQTLQIRAGHADFDPQLDALVKLTHELTLRRKVTRPDLLSKFFEAGYTQGQLVEIILLIGDRTISNLLHAVTQVPVEFPLAEPLD